MKLTENPKFREDYLNYQTKIASLEDQNLQTECTNLLIEFGRAVAAIDAHHESLMTHGIMPSAIADSRSELASLKKKLDSKLANLKV